MNKNAEFIAWLKRARAMATNSPRAYFVSWADFVRSCMNDTAHKDNLNWNSNDAALFVWLYQLKRTRSEVIAMFDNSIKALEEV